MMTHNNDKPSLFAAMSPGDDGATPWSIRIRAVGTARTKSIDTAMTAAAGKITSNPKAHGGNLTPGRAVGSASPGVR